MEIVVDSLLTVAGTWDSSVELMISMSIVGTKWVSEFGICSVIKDWSMNLWTLILICSVWRTGLLDVGLSIHQDFTTKNDWYIYLCATTHPPFTFIPFHVKTLSAEGFLFNAAATFLPVGAACPHPITCKFYTRYKFLLLCLPFSDRAICTEFHEGTPQVPASKW